MAWGARSGFLRKFREREKREKRHNKVAQSPRDAQRADKKEIVGRRRKERPLIRKELCHFPRRRSLFV
jgi:hypothetical protein